MLNLGTLLGELFILVSLGAGGVAALHEVEQTMKELAIDAHKRGLSSLSGLQRQLEAGK